MAARSFLGMKNAVLDDIRHPSDTTMGARVAAWLNYSLFELKGEIEVPEEIDHYSLTLTSGTRTYNLPGDFNGLVGIQMVDKAGDTDFAKGLTEYAHLTFFNRFPSGASDTNAEPSFVTIRRIDGVRTRVPASTDGGAVQCLTTSTADSAVKVAAVGYNNTSRDLVVHGEVALSSSANTAVALLDEGGASYAPDLVFQVSKSDVTAGIVTIRRATGPTTIATLAPWQLTASFYVLEFHDTPDAAYTIRIIYRRAPVAMINDADTPVNFPLEFTEALEWGAKYRARDYVDDSAQRVKEAKGKFEEFRKKLALAYAPMRVEEPRFLMATWIGEGADEGSFPVQHVS